MLSWGLRGALYCNGCTALNAKGGGGLDPSPLPTNIIHWPKNIHFPEILCGCYSLTHWPSLFTLKPAAQSKHTFKNQTLWGFLFLLDGLHFPRRTHPPPSSSLQLPPTNNLPSFFNSSVVDISTTKCLVDVARQRARPRARPCLAAARQACSSPWVVWHAI